MRALRAMVVIGLVFAGCSSDGDVGVDSSAAPSTSAAPTTPPARYTVEVLATHPHDPAAFTEGLVATEDGRLFESVGGYGRSQVREVELATGRVIRATDLSPDFFGEGLAAVGDELVQLTWQEGVAIRWGRDDLVERSRDHYDGEGWGLTNDGERLLQSDGSSTITARDPETFEPTGTFDVTSAGVPVDRLNELEVVDGQLYANVWHSTDIVIVDPAGSGRVTGVIDASKLVPPALTDPEAVLNGIAHRPGDPPDQLLVTGKDWPVLYEVRVVPA